MNSKLKKALVAATLASASLLAAAQTSAPLSRAEVRAELVIYRESGLLDLDRDSSITPDDARYQEAQRRYVALRHSAHFAELVRSFSAG